MILKRVDVQEFQAAESQIEVLLPPKVTRLLDRWQLNMLLTGQLDIAEVLAAAG